MVFSVNLETWSWILHLWCCAFRVNVFFCFLNKHYINVTSGYGFAKLTKCLQKMWPVCCCSSVSPFTFDVYSNHIMPLGLLPYCFWNKGFMSEMQKLQSPFLHCLTPEVSNIRPGIRIGPQTNSVWPTGWLWKM